MFPPRKVWATLNTTQNQKTTQNRKRKARMPAFGKDQTAYGQYFRGTMTNFASPDAKNWNQTLGPDLIFKIGSKK